MHPAHIAHLRHLHHQAAEREAAQSRANEDSIRRLTGDLNDPNQNNWADLYSYPVNLGSIAAAATTQGTVTIQADSKFEWMRTTVQGNLNGGATPWPTNIILPITVLITDTGSGRQLMSAAMPVNLIAGRGDLPFINPEFRIFQPSATIQIQATNFGAATYDNIWFAFLGRKIFKDG
jgi:hypothetical protein